MFTVWLLMDFQTSILLVISLLVRIGFFLYGIYQDNHFTVKYTDIDYFVFHDAAGYVFQGLSPYRRDTYRYTPMLSWLLLPNHHFEWVHFGKMLFVIFDLLTGVMILRILSRLGCEKRKRLIAGALWLLNPIVITISTRGNAESVLCFLVMLSLYYLQNEQYFKAGLVYGLSIHFKIYPIIYCLPFSIYIYKSKSRWLKKLIAFGVTTLMTLLVVTYAMYKLYGAEFLEHAYYYHLYRIDHRHNFSMWNVLLYFNSADIASTLPFDLAKFAFLPQMTVTLGLSYLLFQKASFQDLLNVLFLQTFAFVMYNKVCTSQYFIWYLIFLPFYLANTMIGTKRGIYMLLVWITTQAFWLYQGYRLEFVGLNVFYPGVFYASIGFFLGNLWLLGSFIDDTKRKQYVPVQKKKL